MIKFYYNTSPNPAKVALFLEECRLPYEVIPVDMRKGEQFAPDFVSQPVALGHEATVGWSVAIDGR
jgi:glutathione S-transferase